MFMSLAHRKSGGWPTCAESIALERSIPFPGWVPGAPCLASFARRGNSFPCRPSAHFSQRTRKMAHRCGAGNCPSNNMRCLEGTSSPCSSHTIRRGRPDQLLGGWLSCAESIDVERSIPFPGWVPHLSRFSKGGTRTEATDLAQIAPSRTSNVRPKRNKIPTG